jgi:hypothetical protein
MGIPGMPPHVSLPSASTSATTTMNNVPPATASSADDSRLNSSRSSRARSRSPFSNSNTPSLKRPKNEVVTHDDADGELEIDVQNDDAGSAAGSLSAPHTNGTSSQSLSRQPKDGRESAHSVSSRDSATPKSGISKPVSLSL